MLLPLICLACVTSSGKQCDGGNCTEQEPAKCAQRVSAWESIEDLPYVWGGESREEGGVDCSGAIYNVQKKIGKPIPRTTSKKLAILADGERKHWSEGGCGDWIWWTFGPDRPFGHIGMQVGNETAWQSGSSTGPTSEKLFEGSYWDKNFEVTKPP